MGKGFALVHWIQSKRTEILKCQMIPEKYRRENAIVNLKCRHLLSGVSEMRLAKIVKIEQNKTELQNITVDPETGVIVQMSTNKLAKGTIKKSESLAKKLLKLKESKRKRKKSGKHRKSKHMDESSDSDDSSSSESSSEESANEPGDDSDDDLKAVKSLLSTVTADSIKFIQKLLPLMEKVYKKQQKVSRKQETIIEEPEPDPISIIEPESVNLQSNLEGFLPPMTIAAIFHRCQDRMDWKKLTTDILVEIYGKQLAHLSAKGSRGAQGIDPAVFRTIYDLVNMRLGWILPTKDFVRHVNKVCSNRKKAQRLKMMNNPVDTWGDVQVKLELPTTSTHAEPPQDLAPGPSTIPSYQQYMAKPVEHDTKPIITSIRSTDDTGSSVPSSSMVDVTPSTHGSPYGYISETPAFQNPVSSQLADYEFSS
uniref:MPN_335_0 protein n=1 Tax=Fopius arisanus TaxID=64838 RepID=A0A0C9R3X4_9HYME